MCPNGVQLSTISCENRQLTDFLVQSLSISPSTSRIHKRHKHDKNTHSHSIYGYILLTVCFLLFSQNVICERLAWPSAVPCQFIYYSWHGTKTSSPAAFHSPVVRMTSTYVVVEIEILMTFGWWVGVTHEGKWDEKTKSHFAVNRKSVIFITPSRQPSPNTPAPL